MLLTNRGSSLNSRHNISLKLRNKTFNFSASDLSSGIGITCRLSASFRFVSSQVLSRLVALLETVGSIYITSESRIPASLQKYTLIIEPKDIHHLMAFTELFIADSQSLIVEAAMLGTPPCRFNTFVGRISVLEELQ